MRAAIRRPALSRGAAQEVPMSPEIPSPVHSAASLCAAAAPMHQATADRGPRPALSRVSGQSSEPRTQKSFADVSPSRDCFRQDDESKSAVVFGSRTSA